MCLISSVCMYNGWEKYDMIHKPLSYNTLSYVGIVLVGLNIFIIPSNYIVDVNLTIKLLCVGNQMKIASSQSW